MPTPIPAHELHREFIDHAINHGRFNALAQKHLDDLRFIEGQPHHIPYRNESIFQHHSLYEGARAMAEHHRKNSNMSLQRYHDENEKRIMEHDTEMRKLLDELGRFKAKHSFAESHLAEVVQQFDECSSKLKEKEKELHITSETAIKYTGIVHKVLEALGLASGSDASIIHHRVSELYANYKRSVHFRQHINNLMGHHDNSGQYTLDYDEIFNLFRHYHSEINRLTQEIEKIQNERDGHVNTIAAHAQIIKDIRREHDDVVLKLEKKERDERVQRLVDKLAPTVNAIKEKSSSTIVHETPAKTISPQFTREQSNRRFPGIRFPSAQHMKNWLTSAHN